MSEEEVKHHAFGPSSLKRRRLCPGSWRQEKDLPPYSTEDSNEGTRLHEETAELIRHYIATGDLPDCNHSEYALACFEYFKRIVDSFGGTDAVEIHVEEPVSYTFCGIEQNSGTPDIVIVTADAVFVIDWKFGHRRVDEAADNDQGAGYALAAMQAYKREKAEVHFFNPVIMQDTSANFENKAQIASEVMRIIGAAQEEDAPLCPSEDACRYCKAAHYGTCPALAKTAELAVRKAEALAPLPSLEVMPDDGLSDLAEKCAIVAKLSDRIDAEIRRRCEANGSCGPYRLKAKRGAREISDIVEAFDLCGMKEEDFLACCTLSVAKLEKAYAADKKAIGEVKTEKEGKALFSANFAGIITNKPTRFELVKEGH